MGKATKTVSLSITISWILTSFLLGIFLGGYVMYTQAVKPVQEIRDRIVPITEKVDNIATGLNDITATVGDKIKKTVKEITLETVKEIPTWLERRKAKKEELSPLDEKNTNSTTTPHLNTTP